MPYKTIIYFTILLLSYNCYGQENTPQKLQTLADSVKDYSARLTELEKQASEKSTDHLGTLISQIDFHVKTDNIADYEKGFIPFIELEGLDKALEKLIDKNEIVIKDTAITIIIDYPLSNEYRFKLTSRKGFARSQLVKEVSKAYHRIFKEEELTATIKTIPVDKRTEVYNRNQTNGKYGIWGHDLGDLVLANILVYKDASGEVILSLNIES